MHILQYWWKNLWLQRSKISHLNLLWEKIWIHLIRALLWHSPFNDFQNTMLTKSIKLRFSQISLVSHSTSVLDEFVFFNLFLTIRVFFLNRCSTEFCYLCGGKYYKFWSTYFGHHYSKRSVFGCKHNYKPNNPIQRAAIRGTIFTGKVLVLPVAGTLVLVAGCVALTGLVVASPVLLPYKIAKKLRKRWKQRH